MLRQLHSFGRLSRWAAATAVGAALAAAGCHESQSPTGDATARPTAITEARAERPAAPPPPATQATVQVVIDNFTYDPPEVTIPAGATVTWVNRDDVPHTVTANDRAFNSGALDTDGQYAHSFATPGTYPYFCAVHPHMTGTVIVK